MGSYLEAWKKYMQFSGRMGRREYWTFVSISLTVSIILNAFDRAVQQGTEGDGLFVTLYSLAVFIPFLAATVRRLHDTGINGWELLFLLIPIGGLVAILVPLAKRGDRFDNRYGPGPRLNAIEHTRQAQTGSSTGA